MKGITPKKAHVLKEVKHITMNVFPGEHHN